MRALAILGLPLVLALLWCASAFGAARPLATGFFDPAYIDRDPATRGAWLDRTKEAGAEVVRVSAHWSQLAPKPPSAPQDPASPEYRWAATDDAVRDAASRGFSILLTLQTAPFWAEGAGRANARAGAWKPDPRKYYDFALAAARRYSGTYPDPLEPGKLLPRVARWQMWNEPNLSTYLAPQWVRRDGRWRRASPGLYRRLLNAGYDAVKTVDSSNLVVTAGTAPYGDPNPGGARIQPVDFMRHVLCVPSRSLRAVRCPDKASFDVYSHHPYGVGSPSRRALNDDDAAIPDVHKLARVVRAAVAQGTVTPARRKRFWITELSWDSAPPDPDGVPERRHARWLAEAFYRLWSQGADTITWFQIRDAAPEPSYDTTYQSGVFLRDGTPKTAAAAFRFPFVATDSRTGAVFWGVAPTEGIVAIQILVTGRWRPMRVTRTRWGRVFLVRTGPRRGLFRAVSNGATSLTFRI